jgi:branched-chain amino acid transport system substrate-binding protein
VFDGTWLAEHYKGKRVAIVHDKTPYGQGLADLTKDAMNKAGLKEAAYEAITRGEQDYTALVTKLKDAKVDVIFFGGYHPEAALIVKQAREQGLQAPLMSGDSLNTLEFATLAGKASEGVMFSNAAESRNLPTAQKVVAEFRQAGYEPEGYTLSTYAALEVWAKAVAEAGTTDSAKVAETLRSHQWDTVIGKIGFDAKGDLTASTYTWYVFKDGKYSEAGSM